MSPRTKINKYQAVFSSQARNFAVLPEWAELLIVCYSSDKSLNIWTRKTFRKPNLNIFRYFMCKTGIRNELNWIRISRGRQNFKPRQILGEDKNKLLKYLIQSYSINHSPFGYVWLKKINQSNRSFSPLANQNKIRTNRLKMCQYNVRLKMHLFLIMVIPDFDAEKKNKEAR